MIAYNPKIVTDGLQICVDPLNTKSVGLDFDLITSQAYNRRPSFLEPTGNLEYFTLFAILKKTGTTTGYAINPFTKYRGTTAASWNLYHFGNFNENGQDGVMRYYTTTSAGTWTAFNGSYKATLNEIFEFSLQYDTTSGGQVWFNGSKLGTKTLPGGLKTNTADLNITTSNSVIQIMYTALYNRALSDNEMLQNFAATRGRYGI